MWARKDYVFEVVPLMAGFRDSTRGMERSIGNRILLRIDVMLDKKEKGTVINGNFYF